MARLHEKRYPRPVFLLSYMALVTTLMTLAARRDKFVLPRWSGCCVWWFAVLVVGGGMPVALWLLYLTGDRLGALLQGLLGLVLPA